MMIVGVEAGGLGLPDRDYYTKTDAKASGHTPEITSSTWPNCWCSPASRRPRPTGSRRHHEDRNRARQCIAHPRRAPRSVQRLPPHENRRRGTLWCPRSNSTHISIRKKSPHPFSPTSMSRSQSFSHALQSELANEPLENLKAYLRIHALNGAASSLSSNFEDAQFRLLLQISSAASRR